MDLDNVRIRPDGKVVAIRKHPNNPLIFTEVPENPERVSGDTEWPVKELCEILELAHAQDLTCDAIQELNKHRGSLDEIDVFTIANIIGLRPDSRTFGWRQYQSLNDSPIHDGTIFNVLSYSGGCLLNKRLGMMPRQGMSKHDVERLGKLRIECAYGTMSNGATVQYMQCGQHKVNFMPYPNGEWEYFPLYPWEGVSHIRLGYTSKGLSCWSWQQWRIILKAFAERKEEDVDDLAVVTQIQAYFNLHKRHCPELGLQPIYFFRKPNPKTATQHEFWGFFSFNPDPTGPAGISFRWDIDSHGCLVSDSIPLNAPLQSALEEDSGVDSLEIYFSVDWLTTKDDWHNRIRTVLEQKKVKLDAQFDEDDIVWSDDGDNTRDNPCFVINQLIESVITT